MTQDIKFTSPLQDAVMRLKAIEADRVAGRLSPVAAGHARAAQLEAALVAAGAHFGVALQTPIQISARGEVSLVALPKGAPTPEYGLGAHDNPLYGCGHYGKPFADLLNQYSPRTGATPGATMTPESGWCRLNHFDAERVVMVAAAHELQERDFNQAQAAAEPAPTRRATRPHR